MARKKKPEEHVNHERWLVSYADFITLLFAFFTTMYAIGESDRGKAEKFIHSVNNAFHRFDTIMPADVATASTGRIGAPVMTRVSSGAMDVVYIFKEEAPQTKGPEESGPSNAGRGEGEGEGINSLEEGGREATEFQGYGPEQDASGGSGSEAKAPPKPTPDPTPPPTPTPDPTPTPPPTPTPGAAGAPSG
ncbi:MAG: hypothetical protein NTW86_19990, partial [Candidatus Sumerlaeota bacterium]|nr:hypothetical protein [Candidatus Sumerlaeota bacterium]